VAVAVERGGGCPNEAKRAREKRDGGLHEALDDWNTEEAGTQYEEMSTVIVSPRVALSVRRFFSGRRAQFVAGWLPLRKCGRRGTDVRGRAANGCGGVV
jgi:hypothetical protein